MEFALLKARQREIRENFPASLGLRVHRALSWLGRSEKEDDDLDARFIFLWIAFNAAYANDLHDRAQFTEHNLFSHFVGKLVGLDHADLLHQIVWNEFPKSIRLLIDNRYVFQPFWDFQNGKIDEVTWKERFQRDKAAAHSALGHSDTSRVLAIVLGRLYTLRNQMIHGGATWNSGVNRDQVRDASQIMSKIVPVIIHLMMDNPNELWGDACYPVVSD
jgi:hypothetical protein